MLKVCCGETETLVGFAAELLPSQTLADSRFAGLPEHEAIDYRDHDKRRTHQRKYEAKYDERRAPSAHRRSGAFARGRAKRAGRPTLPPHHDARDGQRCQPERKR